MLPGEVLPRVCIARAAANESVCEDLIVCKCRVSTSIECVLITEASIIEEFGVQRPDQQVLINKLPKLSF